jgi:hypothetical protein
MKMSQDEETIRTIWARRTADRMVDGALAAVERLPKPEQAALLREVARRALWHLPNSRDEVRALVKYFDIENLRQPHLGDDLPDDLPGG